MNHDARDIEVSIEELPAIVKLVFERTHRSLLPGSQKPLGLFVRYLRRKPGRGLAVIYTVDELGKANKVAAHDPHRAISLTLDEQALEGAHICFSEAMAQQAALEVQPSAFRCLASKRDWPIRPGISSRWRIARPCCMLRSFTWQRCV